MPNTTSHISSLVSPRMAAAELMRRATDGYILGFVAGVNMRPQPIEVARKFTASGETITYAYSAAQMEVAHRRIDELDAALRDSVAALGGILSDNVPESVRAVLNAR